MRWQGLQIEPYCCAKEQIINHDKKSQPCDLFQELLTLKNFAQRRTDGPGARNQIKIHQKRAEK